MYYPKSYPLQVTEINVLKHLEKSINMLSSKICLKIASQEMSWSKILASIQCISENAHQFYSL